MRVEEIMQSVEGIVGPSRKSLEKDAITYALGTNHWTLLMVADRGAYLDREDGVEIFMFDGRPMISFRKLLTENISVYKIQRHHYQYEVLYEVK